MAVSSAQLSSLQSEEPLLSHALPSSCQAAGPLVPVPSEPDSGRWPPQVTVPIPFPAPGSRVPLLRGGCAAHGEPSPPSCPHLCFSCREEAEGWPAAHSDVCLALSKHWVLPPTQAPGGGRSSGTTTPLPRLPPGGERTREDPGLGLDVLGLLWAFDPVTGALPGGRLGPGGTSCVVSNKPFPPLVLGVPFCRDGCLPGG